MSVLFTRRGPAPKTGLPASDFAVGESVFLNVGGTLKEFLIVHQGNPNSSLYDASCDGTWLLMKDIYNEMAYNSGFDSKYSNSQIHTYLNGTFLSLLDVGVQEAIKSVLIPYSSNSGSLYVGSSGLSAKIFTLSGYEVGFTSSNMDKATSWADGAKLDYFKNGGSKIAYYNGSNNEWWTRTPNDSSTVWIVSSGGSANSTSCNGTYPGIRPALILPSDIKIDPDTNQIVA